MDIHVASYIAIYGYIKVTYHDQLANLILDLWQLVHEHS